MNSRFSEISDATEASLLSGLDFEEFLTQLFSDLGYTTQKTSASGDYGGDVLLQKDGNTVIVQAKCYSSPVGFDAVKEVHFAKTYYGADEAWIVTTSTYTDQAITGARRASIRLIDGAELTGLIYDAHHKPVSSDSFDYSVQIPVRVISDKRNEIVREAKYRQFKSDYCKRHGDGASILKETESRYEWLKTLLSTTIPQQRLQITALEEERAIALEEHESSLLNIENTYRDRIAVLRYELEDLSSFRFGLRSRLKREIRQLDESLKVEKESIETECRANLEQIDKRLSHMKEELSINEQRVDNFKSYIDALPVLFGIPNHYFPY